MSVVKLYPMLSKSNKTSILEIIFMILENNLLFVGVMGFNWSQVILVIILNTNYCMDNLVLNVAS